MLYHDGIIVIVSTFVQLGFFLSNFSKLYPMFVLIFPLDNLESSANFKKSVFVVT